MSVSTTWASHRGRVAALERCVKSGERRPDDPELINARRNLRFERLAEHVARVVAESPALTDSQLTRIAALLNTGGGDHAG